MSAQPAAKRQKTTDGGADEADEAADKVGTDNSFFVMSFQEPLTDHVHTRYRIDRMMYEGRSKYQHLQLFHNPTVGGIFTIDGDTQSCEKDEFIYHESLVQPAMFLHEAPKTVYVGGGGECATIREVLRHKSVERCVMVDLDKDCVEKCQEILPSYHQGCVNDTRLEIHESCAHQWLRDHDTKFDVIIMDICDPFEAGPGIVLYTKEFYEFVAKERLNPGGVFVTQSSAGGLYTYTDTCTTIASTMRAAWDVSFTYTAHIPSFVDAWSFTIGYNRDTAARKKDTPTSNALTNATPADIDKRIAARVWQDGTPMAHGGKTTKAGVKAKTHTHTRLRFYDGITHRSIMSLPLWLRAGLEQHVTEDNVISQVKEFKRPKKLS